MPPSAAADSMLLRVRALAVASLLALIALGLAWELWLAPTGNRTLALKVLPLAAALVGLLKFRLVTYRWVSLLVWVYFTEGVVRATSGGGIVGGAGGGGDRALPAAVCGLRDACAQAAAHWGQAHERRPLQGDRRRRVRRAWPSERCIGLLRDAASARRRC